MGDDGAEIVEKVQEQPLLTVIRNPILLGHRLRVQIFSKLS